MEKNMDTKFDFNETGRFDFKQVGKRMPYTTPDGFFKDMEKNILEAVKDDTPQAVKIQPQSVKVQPKKRPVFKMIWAAAIGGSAFGAQHRFLGSGFFAGIIPFFAAITGKE